MIGIVLSLESLPKVATLPVDWISKECHDKRQKLAVQLLFRPSFSRFNLANDIPHAVSSFRKSIHL